MGTKSRSALLALTLALVNVLCVYAQLRPDVTPSPKKPTVPKPAQIVIQTSPNAQVYLDDVFKGQASPQGRLVIDNPKAGDHALRLSLAGKRNHEQKVTVIAGQVTKIKAVLRDLAGTVVIQTARGTVKTNPKDGLKYVWIPPGSFQMGCSPRDSECYKEGYEEEKPSHHVTISKGFWIGQTEVTVGAYKRFAGVTGRQMPPEPVLNGRPLNPGWGDEAMPIVDVTWDDAQAYCRWAGGRLPTEAEWEYAARAGSTTARYGDMDEIAWYADNSGRQRLDSERIWKEDHANYEKRLDENGNGLHEVGQKRANGFGLFDILGNVWEWVNDWYDPNAYQNSPSQDPSGATSGQERVLRGGAWNGFPTFVRVSNRRWDNPGRRKFSIGVRCGGEVFAP